MNLNRILDPRLGGPIRTALAAAVAVFTVAAVLARDVPWGAAPSVVIVAIVATLTHATHIGSVAPARARNIVDVKLRHILDPVLGGRMRSTLAALGALAAVAQALADNVPWGAAPGPVALAVLSVLAHRTPIGNAKE